MFMVNKITLNPAEPDDEGLGGPSPNRQPVPWDPKDRLGM